MSLKGEEATTVEHVERPRTFGQKLKAHLRRFWWVHLIMFLAGTLIITLCLVYVAFPRIAQNNVNSSTLTVHREIITNPTPDSVHVHMESISDSDSIFHPALDSFDAKLYLTENGNTDTDTLPPSFGTITIPAGHAGQDVPVTIDQKLKINNLEAFTNYTIAVLKGKTFEVFLSGDMTLHEEAFPANTVNFDKVITMKGLDALKSLKITSLKTTTKQKINTLGQVSIHNPSVLTIEMGQVYTDLYVDDTKIGYSVLNDVTLKPGDNTFDMKGHTSTGQLFIAVKKGKHSLKNVPLKIKGTKSVYNGVKIPYYSAALQSNTLTVDVDFVKLLG